MDWQPYRRVLSISGGEFGGEPRRSRAGPWSREGAGLRVIYLGYLTGVRPVFLKLLSSAGRIRKTVSRRFV